MTLKAERWQQIQNIYYEALERDPGERQSYLDQACKGDNGLRQEVDSLLASHAQAGSFLASPALDIAAKGIAEEKSEPDEGAIIGPYQIIALLGRGGMGEVYLAQDTRLTRKVALKLLPDYFTKEEYPLKRFKQEAKAASALNHPNIVTIFEIGQFESINFIATEYIQGETLRQRLQKLRPTMIEILDVAIQIANALQAAHEAGIIHRDIKPENIMVRPDGYVKVLDFGLAKLTEKPSRTPDSSTTITKINTNPGIILGTVSYMSPEQARGVDVDARSDLFSLGVVLYELITGRIPFDGETVSDVIASILTVTPPPLSEHATEVPEPLEAIVAKLLAKQRQERYQTAADLLVDLRKIKKRLDYETEQQSKFITGVEEAAAAARQSSAQASARTVALTENRDDLHKSSSAQIIIGEIKRHKKAVIAILVALILLLSGAGYLIYRAINKATTSVPAQATPPQISPSTFQTMKVSRLTTSGDVIEAAISPKGDYVAYSTASAGQQKIKLRHIPSSSELEIAAAPRGSFFTDLIFSPDGNFVYYVLSAINESVNVLYKIPVIGGLPRKVKERIHGGLSFSPDGQYIAIIRWKPIIDGVGNSGEKQLLIIKADGSEEKILISRLVPSVMANPAWSPDGSVIAFTLLDIVDNSSSVAGVKVEDGSEVTISSQKWFNAGHIAWLRDGTGMVLSASDTRSGPSQVWHLAYPSAEARRITNDLNHYNNVSATEDLRALVAVQGDEVANIWTAPGGDSSHAKQITTGLGKYGAGVITMIAGFTRADRGGGICWTPDGKIVYHSLASGRGDIWIMNADGSNKKQLTDDSGSNYCPSVSPDGRYIVFTSDRAGRQGIWRINIDGTNPVQLTNDGGDYPRCSPDNKWVTYYVPSTGDNFVMRVLLEGGVPEKLNTPGGRGGRPEISPDGKLIACNFVTPGLDWIVRLGVFPVDGEGGEKLFDVLTVDIMREFHWTPDGRALSYIETKDGYSNIWAQPIAGGPPKQVTNFKSDLIFSFDWSKDGNLACSRGSQPSDVVMISEWK